MFINRVVTDGFSVSFVFARESRSNGTQLELEDFTAEEVDKYFRPVALDPGRRKIFKAAYGCGEDSHEIRQCSTAEYYNMTGSPQRNKVLHREKKQTGIDRAEGNFPTGKTVDLTLYHARADYFLQHAETLFGFYGLQRAHSRFNAYQGKQRARAELANIIINGGVKYNTNRKKRNRRNDNRRKRKKARWRRRLYKRRRLRQGER